MATYFVSDLKIASLFSVFRGQKGFGWEKRYTSGPLSIETAQQQYWAGSYRLHLPAWHLNAGARGQG